MVNNTNRNQFLQSYLNQSFPFPDSVIYYITKNPSTPKAYQKLINCCKYFFIKNSILIFDCLCVKPDFGRKQCERSSTCPPMSELNALKEKHLENICSKFWITEKLCFNGEKCIFSSVVSKIYKCNIKTLIVSNQKIILDEFLSISGTVVICYLERVFIRDKNFNEISLEQVIEHCPKIEAFFYALRPNCRAISSKTAENLLKVPQFLQLKHFQVVLLPESFDIKTFFNFLKTNQKIFVKIQFRQELSEAYRNQLEDFIDEIIETTESINFQTPLILFPELRDEKKNAIEKVFYENVDNKKGFYSMHITVYVFNVKLSYIK